MKKNVLSTLVFLTGLGLASAQVGINQDKPKASLDVTASDQTNVVDGVLVPRLTVTELALKDGIYLADQNGALVFVTAGVGTAGKTINIKTPGFYYYNSITSLWTPLIPEAGTEKEPKIVYHSQTAVYTIVGDEDYILATGVGTYDIMLEDVPGTAIGKKIYVHSLNGQREFVGAGLRGEESTIVYTGTAGMLIYVGKGDGLAPWIYINGF